MQRQGTSGFRRLRGMVTLCRVSVIFLPGRFSVSVPEHQTPSEEGSALGANSILLKAPYS